MHKSQRIAVNETLFGFTDTRVYPLLRISDRWDFGMFQATSQVPNKGENRLACSNNELQSKFPLIFT